jgi:hypothetical protein
VSDATTTLRIFCLDDFELAFRTHGGKDEMPLLAVDLFVVKLGYGHTGNPWFGGSGESRGDRVCLISRGLGPFSVAHRTTIFRQFDAF